MSIDFAQDVEEILSSTGDLPLTAGTYTPQGGAGVTLSGVLLSRNSAQDTDQGLDQTGTRLIVEEAALDTALGAGFIPAPNDTWVVSGQRSYNVETIERREAHLVLGLARREQRGSSL